MNGLDGVPDSNGYESEQTPAGNCKGQGRLASAVHGLELDTVAQLNNNPIGRGACGLSTQSLRSATERD